MRLHYLLSFITIIISIIVIFAAYIEYIADDYSPTTDISLSNVDNEVQQILYYASLAPSSHNAQMWKVTINPDKKEISISVDSQRTLDVVDSDNREAFISIGCYTKALLQAFKAFNYDTKTYIQEENKTITVNYSKQNSGDTHHDILNSLKKRHTDKQIFLDKELDAGIISALSDRYDNLSIIKSTDQSFIPLKTLLLDTCEKQAYDKEAAKELAGYMRFSDDESDEKQDGLNAEQLGMRGIKKFFYYTFVNKDMITKDTFAKQTVDIISSCVNSSKTFILINNDSTTFESRVQTGMTLMDLWMYLNDNDIQVQPISAPLEYIDSAHLINIILNKTSHTDMILRVGYAKDNNKKNTLLRRDLSKYVEVVKD